jgi:antitoxin CcdA
MPDALTKQSSRRRATNVSLSRDFLAEARELGINISQACERGLRETIAEARGERWLQENRKALDSYNSHIEKNGLPLEELRLF